MTDKIIAILYYSGCHLMGSQIMNGINRLLESDYPDLQVPNYSLIPKVGCYSFAYKYLLVNWICYGMAQRDPF
jgi:hypothetical protein